MMRPRCTDEGFTLVELLMAMVVTGILAAVIFQFIIGQDRFVQTQSARGEVQQNARVAAEIITSELRAVAPGGVVNATESEITFRHARAYGILCADAGSNALIVAFPPIENLDALDGNVGVMVQDEDGDWQIGRGESGATTRSADVRENNITNCHPEFQDLAVTEGDIGDPQIMRVRVPGAGFLDGAPLEVGRAPVVLFDQISYTISPEEEGEMRWITRRWNNADTQPMAGPVTAGGLRFEFRDADDTEVDFDDATMRQIRVTVETTSSGGITESERKTSTVFLRNL